VETLVRFALLKTAAQRAGIEAIDRRGGALHIKFHPGAKIDPAKLMALVSSKEGAQFTPAGVLKLPLGSATADARAVLESVKESIETLSK
jgi:transcription-repair coupling factor (superfamily II helicase)